MSYYTEVMITPNELMKRSIIQTNIFMERSSEVLLTGTICNEKCEPVEGAVIEVIAIYYQNHRVKKGYVITNLEGEFTIVVVKNDYINYQLNVYEPLIIC